MLDRLRELRPRHQLLLAAVVAALMLLALGLFWTAFRVTFAPLLTDLRPADAAAVLAELDRRKIDHRLADGGRSVLVPADKLDSAKVEVLGTDLPPRGTVGFELFNKSDIGLTDFAQRINYQRALQGELERTIMGLDGIESVRVHISMGESRVFRDDQVPPKASVTIRIRQGALLSEPAAYGIERLVAAAVPQLTPELVVIVDEEGRVIGQRQPAIADDRALSPVAQTRKAIEDYYEARIRNALQGRSSSFDVAVEVHPLPSAFAAGDVLPAWTPEARTFPLAVTLQPSRMIDTATQTDVRSISAAAIAFDAAKGDAISFGPIAPPQTLPTAQNPQASYPPPSPPIQQPEAASSEAWSGRYWLAGMAVAAMIAGALIVMRRRSGALNEAQRDALIRRLRSALSDETPGAEAV